jgi:hypothetical protein
MKDILIFLLVIAIFIAGLFWLDVLCPTAGDDYHVNNPDVYRAPFGQIKYVTDDFGMMTEGEVEERTLR